MDLPAWSSSGGVPASRESATRSRITWATGCMAVHPQPFLEAFWNLQMPADLVEGYGYPALTDEVKDQILGLNAARLFAVDVRERRGAIQADRLTQIRQEYQQNPFPSHTQYGWVWVEDGGEPTVPVGETVTESPSPLGGEGLG